MKSRIHGLRAEKLSGKLMEGEDGPISSVRGRDRYRPNIMLFIDSLGAGGAQRQLVQLAIQLHSRGWPVSVCTYYPADFFAGPLVSHGIKITSRHPGSRVGRIRACHSLIREARADIVVSFLKSPTVLAELVRGSKAARFRLVASERSMDAVASNAMRARMALHTLADAIVTNSETQANVVRSTIPWLADRTVCIRNCVDPLEFVPGPNRLLSDPIRVLTLASFLPGKNATGLIRGFTMFLEAGANRTGILRWSGQRDVNATAAASWQEAVALAKCLGVDDKVMLSDTTVNVLREYHWADVFCLPSFLEGCPNVIAEAMACGVPILASRIGDIPSLVQDGVHGFLFDPRRPEMIADALARFSALSARERLIMGRHCRTKALELFSIDRFASAWESVLVAVADNLVHPKGR